MTLLRLLNVQGIAGLVVSFCLGVLLILQKDETRHWRKQSGQFEQVYRGEQVAFAGTVANYRAAAEQARAADRAAAERVQAEQEDINERSNHALDSLWPMLALALGACASKPHVAQPIPVLAEAHQCPAFPLPPPALIKPPAKTDFLPHPAK